MSENQRPEYTEDERRIINLLREHPDKKEEFVRILTGLTDAEFEKVKRRAGEAGIVL